MRIMLPSETTTDVCAMPAAMQEDEEGCSRGVSSMLRVCVDTFVV